MSSKLTQLSNTFLASAHEISSQCYNIKEVNLLITVYSIYTAYNLTKSRKKREVTIDKTLLGMSYIKQGNSTYIKDYLEVLPSREPLFVSLILPRLCNEFDHSKPCTSNFQLLQQMFSGGLLFSGSLPFRP